MNDNHNPSLKHLYALLSASNSELATNLKPKIAQHDRVAAKLIISNTNQKPTIAITTIEDSRHTFKLDFQSKIYTSKGNWLWVRQIEILNTDVNILSLSFNPRVIDIPYYKNNICAFWFFKYFNKEISEYINCYL